MGGGDGDSEHTEETSAYVEAAPDSDAGFVVESFIPQEPLEGEPEVDIWAEASPGLVEVDGEWIERAAPFEDEDDDELPEGDGPFAVALDTPAPVNRFAEALSPPPAAPAIPQSVVDTLSKPIQVQRKTPKRKPKARAKSAAAPVRKRSARKIAQYQAPRRYPVLMGLLKNAPEGGPRLERAGPPVPGTFFPASRDAPAPGTGKADPTGLDGLLSTMAEGLLIGESGDGHAEVRITLRDEFFAGTELRLVLGERGVRAELHPPDRTTYWHLSGEMHALTDRLTERGLKVESIEVCEP